jgi:hypothetical protein
VVAVSPANIFPDPQAEVWGVLYRVGPE